MFTSILKIGAVATAFLLPATMTVAAPLASFDLSGDYQLSFNNTAPAPEFTAINVTNGIFSGNVSDDLLSGAAVGLNQGYRFSAKVSANDTTLIQGSFDAKGQEILDAFNAAPTISLPPELVALALYIGEGPGTPFPLYPGFVFGYDVDNLTANTIDGTFALSLAVPFFLDGIQDIDPQGGDFAIDLRISTVPLPAGLPLLLVGLGGFAVLRRRSTNT